MMRPTPIGGKMNTQDIDKRIGENIKRGRNLRDITQEQLAESIGITFQQVQKYEKAQNRVATSRLVQIAMALNLPFSSFVGDIKGLPESDGSLPDIAGKAFSFA